MTEGQIDTTAPVKDERSTVTAPRGRVLVVDDVKLLCEGILRLLRQASLEGVVAHNVRDAIELVRSQQFDLVITDIRMAGPSGADLVEELARLRPDLKCIVITGYATTAIIARLGAAGNVIGVHTKPLNTQKLLEKVSSFLKPQ
jgi:two-component system, response regulator PdtaR